MIKNLYLNGGGRMRYYSSNEDNLTSTKKSSDCSDERYSSFLNNINKNLNFHMFFQDFCSSYSIHLSQSYQDYDFYKFEGNSENLNDLFGYDFLRYNLDDLLANIAENLVLFGKAYIERIYWYDENNKLKRISYECLNCKKFRVGRKYLYYKVYRERHKKLKGKIEKESIVEFRLKDLGFTKGYIVKRIRRLRRFDTPDIELVQSKFFDFDKYVKKNEYHTLKKMKNIYWNARNNNNQFLSEPYLVYRIIRFDMLQNSFLEYMISKINEDLIKIGESCGFSGAIKYNSKVENYDSLTQDLKTGQKTCEQISKIIFRS